MSKKPWIAPFLSPHQLGALNKFGLRPARGEYQDQLEGHSVEDLVAQFGSPLFVTSERRLRENAHRLRRAFQSLYANVVHGWSYKTNYTSAICNILHQEGCWAEVVSRFEYEKARRLGVPGERILFNGPNKSPEILRRAIAEGAHLHVDHGDELAHIEAIAREQNRVVEVTLRLNLNTGYSEPWSRFGFNLESGEAHEAARHIELSPQLRLSGLHSHIGTFILEPRAYAEQMRLLCEFTAWLEQDGNMRIQSLDIGGGLPSQNALQGVYLPPAQSVPPPEEFARAVVESLQVGMEFRVRRNQPLPTLIFESGRATVDDAQHLITSVVGGKRLPDGRRAAVLDAGVNTLFTAFWYNHQVKLTRPPVGPPQETVLYGPLCMNIDVLRSSIQIAPLRPGDRLLLSPVGAYNNTQWMQFIEYRPAIVLIQEDGRVSVIRRAENLDVMCAQDELPEHLRDCQTQPWRELSPR
jgi:diaminopimelate decarboxylase